ncbi:MAG: winged helix-turn-helix domain-containing protein [Candidatus Bathyarchaeia archaeon]
MTSQLKSFIEQLASPKGPGPSTTFSMFHIFSALELLANKPIGRNKLAEKLNVGDGAIRTIVSRLKDAGLIVTSREGCKLTEKGLSVWKSLEEAFPVRVEMERTSLTTSEYNYAFLVKNKGHKVKSGIEQRDAAIMGGNNKQSGTCK